MNLRMLIVDDHEFFRRTLCRVLEELPGCEVIGTAADGDDAIELAARLEPTLIVMDMQMPRRDGLSACRHIKAVRPQTQVILYSGGRENLAAAQQSGVADACLLKDELFTELSAFAARFMSESPSSLSGASSCSSHLG